MPFSDLQKNILFKENKCLVYKARQNKNFGHFIGSSKAGSASLREFYQTSRFTRKH